MTLREKQSKFAKMVALLLQYIDEQGYEVTFGDAYATNVNPVIAFLQTIHFDGISDVIKILRKMRHHTRSCHYMRLAIDLNLFKDGKYLMNTEDHRIFGEFWESIGGTWGGRFNDGNHYSLEHNGRK